MRPAQTDTLRRLSLLCGLVALAGCGGGGGGADSAAPPPIAGTPTPSPPAPATPSPQPPPPAPPPVATEVSRATCNIANFQAQALALVNSYRRNGASCGSRGVYPGVTVLQWNNALTQAALVHSDDMLARNFVDHTGSDGSTPGQRVTAAGYVWSSQGENIAAGPLTLPEVMAGWMASDGHCANIMHAEFRDIGLACVLGGSGNRYRSYWTMSLGVP